MTTAEPSRIEQASAGAVDMAALLQFMLRLGQMHLACGEAVSQVELLLHRIATVYGAEAHVVVLPTALFIEFGSGHSDRLAVGGSLGQTLRLEQIAAVYALVDVAERGAVTPEEGLRQLTEILAQPGRFRPVVVIVGHAILTVGLALILLPTSTNLAAAAVLGTIVGGVKVLNKDRPVLALPMPVFAAVIVSALVFVAARRGFAVNPLHVLVPPLVTFLPGALLAMGMVELAYGDMVSGTSRLITGLVQLVLLALGIAAGAALVGVSSTDFLSVAPQASLQPWAAWAGVLVFGLGVYLHFSAPRNSLLWMLFVLVFTFAAQKLGAGLVGNEISGFFGMLVATPLGYLIQKRFKGPPAMVTFLPSFWLVVPGSLGLFSVARMLSDRAAGLDGLVTAVFVVASIALGCLVGASAYKWLTETFDWWSLQIGRAGSLLERAAGGRRDDAIERDKRQ